MKKKKYLYFVYYLVFIVLILISCFYFINDNNNYNFVTKKIKGLSADISRFAYYPFYSKNKDEIRYEDNETLRKEIKELEETLDLNKSLVDRKIVNAVTIKRSTSFWYNVITIDKGKKDKIENGNIVVNSKGVIGRVIKSNNNSSEVKLLTSKNKNDYISAMFLYDNNYYYGLIDDYNIKKNELHLKNVVGDFSNLENIEVVTSGLSHNNVKGMVIGKIKYFKKTNYGISNDIYITPSANFNNINVVSVLVG